MRLLRASLTIAVLLAAATAGHAQSAYDYPWCALYGDSDGPGATSCYYKTREQCMRTLSGIGGTRIQSPFTAKARAPSRRRGVIVGIVEGYANCDACVGRQGTRQ